MAEQRADEALASLLAGKPLARRERKAAYNGASGVPIREEVLARVGETVITRNGYGAHCLNPPSRSPSCSAWGRSSSPAPRPGRWNARSRRPG
jgi:hypothetical protein